MKPEAAGIRCNRRQQSGDRFFFFCFLLFFIPRLAWEILFRYRHLLEQEGTEATERKRLFCGVLEAGSTRRHTLQQETTEMGTPLFPLFSPVLYTALARGFVLRGASARPVAVLWVK